MEKGIAIGRWTTRGILAASIANTAMQITGVGAFMFGASALTAFFSPFVLGGLIYCAAMVFAGSLKHLGLNEKRPWQDAGLFMCGLTVGMESDLEDFGYSVWDFLKENFTPK